MLQHSNASKARLFVTAVAASVVENLEGRRLLSGGVLRDVSAAVSAQNGTASTHLVRPAVATSARKVTVQGPVRTTAQVVAVKSVTARPAVASDGAVTSDALASTAVLLTDADFDRMKAGVAAGSGPVYDGWVRLVTDSFSQDNLAPRPLETVIRGGTGQNYNQMVIDMQRTYQLALRWKVSGETRWADLAVAKLNAWSTVHKYLTGNADRFLASGLYAFDWAAAASIMKDYAGWAAADQTQFATYLVNVYYPLQHQFFIQHNDAAITNYWANWDLANIEGMMAIGVFAQRQDIYDEAVNYLFKGGGNGAIDKAFYYRHPGNLYQWQESGRDQGHTVLGMQLFGHIARMAANQGLDLYAWNNHAFLAAAEYVAKYNLGHDVPFQTYNWGTGQNGAFQSHTGVSGAGRGALDTGFALIYGHYVEKLGMAAPYVSQWVNQVGAEGRGSGDDMGFGTLTYRRTPVATANLKPIVTAAEKGRGNVQLDWFGTVNAPSYNIYRSTSENGTYVQIASNVGGVPTYTDRNLPAGLYYYKITGLTPTGETAASAVVSATSTTRPYAGYAFDENTGTTAADGTGGGRDGLLVGGATWTAGRSGSAVNLDGVDDYVRLPQNIMQDVNDFTISAWVKLNSTATWSRIFDFGDTGRGRYMYLAAKNGGGQLEFATETVYDYNKQWVAGGTIPNNVWTHVAVTLSNRVATLYINGQVVAANPNMDFPSAQIGAMANNYIGKSQYGWDATLKGAVDDFRITKGALSTAELYTLATGQSAPATPAAPASLTATAVVGNAINLSWAAVAGASNYTLYRGTTANGPYTVIATRLTTLAYNDAGRTAGTRYYYVVRATNAGGEGAASPEASAVALPPMPGVPSSLTAKSNSSTTIVLNWNGSFDAATYSVKRATVSGGPYTTVASGLTALTYTDTNLTAGTAYFYVVTAVNAAGESAVSNEAGDVPSDFRARITFNEGSGTAAADITGNGFNATLNNGAAWSSAGKLSNALQLDGTDDYASLPSGIVSDLGSVTVSAWVNPSVVANWQRVFDFGTGTNNYMFLTPKNGSVVRFAIRTPTTGEQVIDGSAPLAANAWSHVAFTWSNNVGRLYVNGVQVGQNSSMTLSPTALGTTTQNYVGKSQFNDPYFNGRVDDLRVYSRALTAAEVNTLATRTAPAAPTALIATPGSSEVALNWAATSDATHYAVKRGTLNGGPYVTIATDVTATSFTDNAVVNGTTYYYVVSAVNVVDESVNSAQASATPAGGTAPTISLFGINDGSAQRSRITSFTLTFDEPVALDGGDLTLLLNNAAVPNVTTVVTATGLNSQYTITFSGSGLTNGSLGDGHYTLVLNGASITNGSNVALASSPFFSFHRLFGDSEGNGAVDFNDFLALQNAFGSKSGDTPFSFGLDADGNDLIDFNDFLALQNNFGKTL